ncbi:CueP family metal-binding protein [Ornithinibacillus scapharcae]|uniref:CueP family metal-binding protein n=1 Tax=Ornithinibacillus scapharcae TaxID=1147159 RepID=UPI000225B57F|nr:CueP family metal-binding protein [Ornithinibacillus scapharcae]
MKKFLFSIIGILFLITGCDDTESRKSAEDIKEIVHDYTVGSFEDVSASITSHELIVTNSNNEKKTYELPEDEFFVSIAPFIETTHPCEIHSLTSCQGELVEEDFEVYIEDTDGNIILDETVTSFENGFIDLWLPREKNLQISIKHKGKTATSEISTFEGDNTCITTMQLL